MNVNIKSEKITIPTYELGQPEKNPVFFEKRVYQGSSGKVYPVPFIDKVYDHKVDKEYDAEILENDYVRLVMLPEIGGRIFEAQDKSNNNYDFFYKQEVIKPALVGLAGPWISGGVEFNWPQHHRPGTYLPTDVFIEKEKDGAKTVWMSEYDPMHHLKGMHGIRVRPNSSLVELRGRLFNRTPLTQTFLWWANVAVEVHEDYQSFFPSDVHYVADHAVRAMSSFPNAENDYYGIPYHQLQGKNDLRKYNNIPVPTSYMVCDTNYDFFGGYDAKAKGGFIHVANRHIAPGKKQWTWGNEAFGKAWDRELSDNGAPYFELMAGVYTDNQPDFSYLLPYETKTFSQFWWSYKDLGAVQNANKDFAIRLEILEGNRLDLGVATSKISENLTFILAIGEEKKEFKNISISPDKTWQNQTLTITAGDENKLSFYVIDSKGNEQLSFHRREIDKTRTRNEAKEPLTPEKLESSHELTLIAEHLEQYRHPTRYPEPYLKEAIKRDALNDKAYTLLGRLELRKGEFEKAETYLRKAIEIITSYHPNPSSGEALYYCGLACRYQNKLDEAYKLFYKAIWNYEWRASSYYQLATLDCLKLDYTTALEHIENALDTNRQNNKAYILKACILKRINLLQDAEDALFELQQNDKLDQWAEFELATIRNNFEAFLESSRNDAQTVIDIAFDYIEAGMYEEAVQLLELHHNSSIPQCAVPNPMQKSVMTYFILAWTYEQMGNNKLSQNRLAVAESASPDYFFPSRIYEQLTLEWALDTCKDKTVVAFGLGNYYFDLKLYSKAINVWETASHSSTYATLHRNLGIAYWNTKADKDKAENAYLKAIEYAPDDMKIQYEYDQLRKKMNHSPKERLEALEKIKGKLVHRDDFCIEYIALLNFAGKYQEALDIMTGRPFHPWEGGEGQVLRQYSYACIRLGLLALEEGDANKALAYFENSLDTPDNLGEKYHPLQAIAHINYLKGKAYKTLGKNEEAEKCFLESANEEGDFIDMAVSQFSEMSYYRALSLNELNKTSESQTLLNNIKEFAQAQLKEKATIDYFATSLPQLLVFEHDIDKQNQCNATYLLALAEYGLSNKEIANNLLQKVIILDAMHIGAKDLLK